MAKVKELGKKNIRWMALLQTLIATIVIVAIAYPLYYYTGPKYAKHSVILVDEGWDVEVHGESFEDVTLSETLFGMCNRGDVMVLTHDMTEDLQIPNPVLECYTVHSVIDVYIGDELIYSYGHELYEKEKLLGYGSNYVSLPNDYIGQQLRVVFIVTENNAFEGIPAMKLRDGSCMIQGEVSGNRMNLTISLFLVLFGLLGMCVSAIMFYKDRSFFKTFCITTFSVLIGVWTICSGDLITLFVTELRVKVYLEYTSFYLMLLPFLGYFRDTIEQEDTPKWIKYYYRAECAVNLTQVFVVFFCQFTNITRFPTFVTSEHIMIAMALALALMVAYVDIRKKKAISSIGVGFAIAFLVALIELIRFNLSKYFIGFSGNRYESTMEIAALTIVVTLFVDFCQKIRSSLVKTAQAELLERLAYMDELTGLANRRKCDEVMDELKTDYAIVSLDMNGLKYINDTFGHETGDRALVAFAKILGKAFPNDATVGRMGGDEFVAILPETDEVSVLQCIEEMNRMIKKYNDTACEEYDLSSAWGIATGLANDNPHGVYSIADAKMYERKRKMKQTMHDTSVR